MKPDPETKKYIETIQRLLENPDLTTEEREDLKEEMMTAAHSWFVGEMFEEWRREDDERLNGAQGHLLVRHAQSEGNIGLPSDTPGGIPLTAQGREQAAAFAAAIERPPDRIVVSPYIRTHQTAAPLRERFPSVLVETWAVQEFTYLNPGKYAGTTEVERSGDSKAYWQACDPFHDDGGGAESFAGFIARVDETLARLRASRGQQCLVFTHGYFMLAAELRLSAPEVPVDAALMQCFRDLRRKKVPGNCDWREVSWQGE